MSYFYLITQQCKKTNIDVKIDLNLFLNDVKKLNCPYCYIYHDNVNETTLHVHLILLCCELLKVDLIKLFPYADIEIIKSIKGAYEYLYHKNNNDKISYNESDIIFDNHCSKDLLLLCNKGLKHNTSKSKEYEDIENMISDLMSCKYQRLSDYLQIYGVSAFKNYHTLRELFERFNFIGLNEFEVKNEEEKINDYS